jgi:hypothetical protein
MSDGDQLREIRPAFGMWLGRLLIQMMDITRTVLHVPLLGFTCGINQPHDGPRV